MKIFRVENKNKEGPYRSPQCPEQTFWTDNCIYGHLDSWNHPDLYKDEDLSKVKKWIENNPQYRLEDFQCGFHSMEQLNNWFSYNEKQKLNDYGYMISEQLALVVFQFAKQVMFIPAPNSPTSFIPLVPRIEKVESRSIQETLIQKAKKFFSLAFLSTNKSY